MSLIEGRQRFTEIVENYAASLQILSGHVHRPYQIHRNGICASIGGSPAFQIGLDLRQDAPDTGFVSEPYHYFIHAIAGENITIHPRVVDL